MMENFYTNCKGCSKSIFNKFYCSKCEPKKILNLACGEDIRPECVNVDIMPRSHLVLKVDIEKKLPFKNDFFDEVLNLGALQYIEPKNFFKVMEELYRVMKPGAIMKVTHRNNGTILHKTQMKRSDFRFFSEKDFYSTHNKARFEVLKYKKSYNFLKFGLGGLKHPTQEWVLRKI